MKHLTLTEKEYWEAIGIGHWWNKQQLIRWFTGGLPERHKKTERVLPRLVKKGAVKEARWGKKKVYAVKGSENFIEHGLACTECMVRFIQSDPDSIVIGEDYFRIGKFGCVPEWGIRYPKATLLLLEFCTRDNVTRSGKVQKKVNMYKQNLHKIEAAYQAQATVLFVLDIQRDFVQKLSQNLQYGHFVDYETFLTVKPEDQLTEPIYFWNDGNTYPLRA